MIISADMAIAIPIAMLSIALVAHSIGGSQSYYLAYAKSSYIQIRYYSISQQMLEVLDQQSSNSSQYLETLQNLSRFYNVSSTILNVSDYQQCDGYFCRVVELGGPTKILMIR